LQPDYDSLKGITRFLHRRYNRQKHLLILAVLVALLGALYFIGRGPLYNLWSPPNFFYGVGYHELLLAVFSGLVIYSTITLRMWAGVGLTAIALAIVLPYDIKYNLQQDVYYRIAAWVAKNLLLALFIGAAIDAKEQQRLYLRELFNIEEQQRRHLARELHDDAAQGLIDADHGIDDILARKSSMPQDVTDSLQSLRRQIDQVLEATRRTIQGLRPPLLDEMGIVPALIWLCDGLSDETNIRVERHIDIQQARLTPDIELALFRISQEALTNVKKHSSATELRYTLKAHEGKIKLIISDNGRGFVPFKESNVRSAGKMGLIGIRERARLLDGTFAITSAIGEGTTIKIEIRLPDRGDKPAQE
jgi:signal transduction histidine kinase